MPEDKPLQRPPHVCIIAHAHPDMSKGGGEAAAYRQFRALRAAGWRVSFVAASEDMGRNAAPRAAPVIMSHGTGEHVFSLEGMAPDRLFWRDPSARREVVELLAGLGAEVYHFHHYWRVGTDLIGALRRARPDALMAMTLHEMLAICQNHGQMIRTAGNELCDGATPLRCLGCFPEETIERIVLRKALLLQTLRGFDRLIYPSAFIRGRYEEWGLPTEKAVTLENLLEGEMLAAPRAPVAVPGIETCFAFFGQATPFKGLDLLVAAFAVARARRQDLHLAIHGTTREGLLTLFPGLEETVAALGPALTFAGAYGPRDTLALMRRAGWVVMPSIWWENSPVVIQEALRAATPLIVADIGGMAEKVRPGLDGLHFRRGSVTDLARVLLEAAEPGRRDALLPTLADTIGTDAFLAALARAYIPGKPAAT